jgi:thiamine-monophosphate kinase
MAAEFDLIARCFARAPRRADVPLGIGDDAALLTVPPRCELVVAVDTLVAGVHFLADCAPHAIGHKALAVNLSDLAAMGADPAWALLALTTPDLDEAWAAACMAGFEALARRHDVDLVGGDTTRGPLTITVTALGHVPAGQALRRAGARVGDAIYVSGTVGAAGAALAAQVGGAALPDAAAIAAQARLDYPQPRVALGRALRGLAHAAIDVSDGVAADLGHMLTASGVGATLELAALPLGPGVPDTPQGRLAALVAGDDYELCFAVPPGAALGALATVHGPLTRIGTVEAAAGLRVLGSDGAPVALGRRGYEHHA